jgi:hypothetical protein
VAGSSENDMVKGRRTGQGRHSNKNGSTYEGDFVAGKAHGNGVKTWASGAVYTGQWQHNKQHGQGVLTQADGSKQEGTFVNNRFTGDTALDSSPGFAGGADSAGPSRHPLAGLLGGFSKSALRKQETIVTKRDGSRYVERVGEDGTTEVEFVAKAEVPSYLQEGGPTETRHGADVDGAGGAGVDARVSRCLACVGSASCDARARAVLVATCDALVAQFELPAGAGADADGSGGGGGGGGGGGSSSSSPIELICRRYCATEAAALTAVLTWARRCA